MKQRVLVILVGVLLCSTQVQAASTVQRISKVQNRDLVQIFISFDRLPEYRHNASDRRLDLIMQDTEFAESLPLFPEDEVIVKILTIPRQSEAVVSFFFRYPPQQLTVSTGEERVVVVELLPGNRFSKTYEEVSRQLSGITILERDQKDYSNPVLSSPYAANWRSFFTTYESAVTIEAPVRFTLPDFPAVRLILSEREQLSQVLNEAVRDFGNGQAWSEAAALLQQQLATTADPDLGALLALTYGEVLLRMDHFEGAYKQLYLLNEQYPESRVGKLSAYLLALLQATHGDPFTADYELRLLAESIPGSHPLAPYLQLSRAETSLATGQINQMQDVLAEDDLAFPEKIMKIRELRQADLLWATGRAVPAFVTYRLFSRSGPLRDYPASLNAFCSTLYEQAMWSESAECYQQLSTLLTDRAQLGLAYYREAMSRWHQGRPTAEVTAQMNRVEDTFPNSEAGFRAALKSADLRYLADPAWQETAKMIYRALAEESTYRAVTEEALMKEALLHVLHGDQERAISLAMDLLRTIRSGPIVVHAEALLIQLLPLEIKRLIDAGDLLEALVLSRQNRRYFDNGWIPNPVLVDLADAYERLGIYQEALDLYLYLVSQAPPEQRESFYLPLTRTAFAKGDYNLVEDFVTQYQYNFPEGSYRDDIVYYRLQALYAQNDFSGAVANLPEPLPQRADYQSLAALLFFNQENYQQAVSLWQAVQASGAELKEDQQFMLAESLFQLRRDDQAEPALQTCSAIARYRGQCLYRLAQIAKRRDETEQALNFLQKIAETEDDSLWKSYAQRELQLARMGAER